jgi:hypothetical protein
MPDFHNDSCLNRNGKMSSKRKIITKGGIIESINSLSAEAGNIAGSA